MSRVPGGEATGRATWSSEDVGDLTGRVALVTGANSGIGYETAKALADHGAHVIMACRNEDKARQARDKIESEVDRCSLELLQVDLADLVSVRRAAEVVLSQHARLDLLVNNAGVMGTPYRLTADGFELQMGTNHFGHFASHRAAPRPYRHHRAVAHRHRQLASAPCRQAAARRPGRSRVTQHLGELRHLEAGQPLVQRGARPPPRRGGSPDPGRGRASRLGRGSNLAGNGAVASRTSRVRRRLGRAAGTTLGQSTAAGALPILCAATSTTIRSGQYIGPAHLFGLFGRPRVAVAVARAPGDVAAAAELWRVSEELTGVRYSVDAPV